MIYDLFKIKKLKVPDMVWRDGKKLGKLLDDLVEAVNALTKCAIQQTQMTATEMIARPTYAEEFQNIRDNLKKAIKPTECNQTSQDIDEDWENVSHYSKISTR